jgi:hypothetical protein
MRLGAIQRELYTVNYQSVIAANVWRWFPPEYRQNEPIEVLKDKGLINPENQVN